ncbi:hypothetical protein A2160_05065 [Candidatus Beckwithbacteria bacterium RBG_13_42_9]|uniref:Uncharacterized protein n=1 Tax=Candidatus Beckwithbacteria bacterium RBG_13_42_9 TaxID=1797457 RepID=A0A1F5E6L3_9BACT|nr:MAG: hypothetical protein A2160_05065 [Candidatus Beckwithbacteria bacterium RBG_13_42_9]
MKIVDASGFQSTALWATAEVKGDSVVFVSPVLPLPVDRVAWMEAARCDAIARTGNPLLPSQMYEHDLDHGVVVNKPGSYALTISPAEVILEYRPSSDHTPLEQLDIRMAPPVATLSQADLQGIYIFSCQLPDPSGDREHGLVCIDLS